MLVEARYPPLNGKKSCALPSSSRRAAPGISATARELRVRTLNVVDYRYFNSQAVPFSMRNDINEYVNTTTACDHPFDSNRDLAASRVGPTPRALDLFKLRQECLEEKRPLTLAVIAVEQIGNYS